MSIASVTGRPRKISGGLDGNGQREWSLIPPVFTLRPERGAGDVPIMQDLHFQTRIVFLTVDFEAVAKVDELHFEHLCPVVHQQDVVQLQVVVDDADAVKGFEGRQ